MENAYPTIEAYWHLAFEPTLGFDKNPNRSAGKERESMYVQLPQPRHAVEQ